MVANNGGNEAGGGVGMSRRNKNPYVLKTYAVPGEVVKMIQKISDRMGVPQSYVFVEAVYVYAQTSRCCTKAELENFVASLRHKNVESQVAVMSKRKGETDEEV